MEKKNEKHVNMQMVEFNHEKFAVELMNGNISVNLSQMAKPFGKSKQPSNWLKTDEAKEYLNAISVPLKVGTEDLVKIKQGGSNQGTWVTDRRIAIRFAQWLSVDFAIAVDDMLVKLLTKQAFFAQAFNGVPPVASGGQLWYNYLDVLASLGYSTGSGTVGKRKRKAPQHFCLMYGRNFITLAYCNFLKSTREYRQLTLNFFNDGRAIA